VVGLLLFGIENSQIKLLLEENGLEKRKIKSNLDACEKKRAKILGQKELGL